MLLNKVCKLTWIVSSTMGCWFPCVSWRTAKDKDKDKDKLIKRNIKLKPNHAILTYLHTWKLK